MIRFLLLLLLPVYIVLVVGQPSRATDRKVFRRKIFGTSSQELVDPDVTISTNGERLAAGLPPLRPRKLYGEATRTGPIKPCQSSVSPIGSLFFKTPDGVFNRWPLDGPNGPDVWNLTPDGSINALADRCIDIRYAEGGPPVDPTPGGPGVAQIFIDTDCSRSPDTQKHDWTFDQTNGQLTAHWQDQTGTGQPPFVTSTFYLAYTDTPSDGDAFITGSLDPIAAVQAFRPGWTVVPATFYLGLTFPEVAGSEG